MTKLLSSNYDKTKQLKFWQNSNCDKTIIKKKNSITQNVTKLKLLQNSKTQTVTKLKNSNNDKT